MKSKTKKTNKSPKTVKAEKTVTRRRNRRYRYNDSAIMESILKDPTHCKVSKICREAGITRISFYRHYKSIDHALATFTAATLDAFAHFVADLPDAKSPAENRRLFWRLCLFITRREDDVFYYIFTNGANHGLLCQMLELLYPKLYINWTPRGVTPPTIADRPVRIFFCLVMVILCEWAEKEHCDIRASEPYIAVLVDITANARRRCM